VVAGVASGESEPLDNILAVKLQKIEVFGSYQQSQYKIRLAVYGWLQQELSLVLKLLNQKRQS
jgi:hypothetical protein